MVVAPRTPTEDRRGSPRQRLTTSLKLQHPAPLHPEHLTGTLVDVSPLGLSIDVQGLPVAGAELLVELTGADGFSIEMPARIVRVEARESNVHRIGCELLSELTRRDYSALRQRLTVAECPPR